MITIGLTGSIAMGKSAVADILTAEGIPIFDADKEVHALYDSAKGVELLQTIVPAAIVEGCVSRSALSRIAMHEPAILSSVEKIIHAEIAHRRAAFKKRAQQQGCAEVVFDIPLLFEKSLDEDLDAIIVVSAPPALQRQRALARPGMSPEKLDLILARQMPDTEKRQKADYVIENDTSLADLKTRTLAVLAAIRKKYA